jgi:hypothetical protein
MGHRCAVRSPDDLQASIRYHPPQYRGAFLPDILRLSGPPRSEVGFGRFAGAVKADYRERREGLRVKFWYDVNSLKAYDKFGNALRLGKPSTRPHCSKSIAPRRRPGWPKS